MVSVSVLYLFYQPMDEKIKTWNLPFPAKENPNVEKALFDWPIVLQYDVKESIPSFISRKFVGHKVFSPVRSLNQPKTTRVCIRSINQSNRSISVRLLFLFCPCVFISRSYENRSIRKTTTLHVRHALWDRRSLKHCESWLFKWRFRFVVPTYTHSIT